MNKEEILNKLQEWLINFAYEVEPGAGGGTREDAQELLPLFLDMAESLVPKKHIIKINTDYGRGKYDGHNEVIDEIKQKIEYLWKFLEEEKR